MSTDRDDVVNVITRITIALADVAPKDRLLLLATIWLWMAANVRNEAQTRPGGFTDEQAEQVRILTRLIASVESAEPDPVAERLYREGDLDALRQHTLASVLTKDPFILQ